MFTKRLEEVFFPIIDRKLSNPDYELNMNRENIADEQLRSIGQINFETVFNSYLL